MIEYENLKLVNARFEREFREAFDAFVGRGWYILGEQTAMFEKNFAAMCGAKHCIGVASGLDALALSLQAFGFPAGSEVIVPSNTYIATVLSVVNCGLKPVLVEPEAETCNIDPELIEAAVTPDTRAVIAVHLYGKPCRMDRIQDVCRKHGLRLIEDCAQSHGARYRGRVTGTFGDAGAFSFYPTKNLGAMGDAGAIVTDSDRMADKLRAMRNYGSEKKYHNRYTGFNSRLDELQAAFLNIKLRYLDSINEHKRRLAGLYFDGIDCPGIVLPARDGDCYDVYHIFNVRLRERDALKAFLLEKGIGTEIHYPVPPNRQEGYRRWFDGVSCPVSEEIHATTLSLPISYGHTDSDIMKVIDAINSFRGRR
jgi:dTDP-4-amino-4,6-dideoxygalactose transaminase